MFSAAVRKVLMATSRHATYDDEHMVHLYLVDAGRHPLLTNATRWSWRSASKRAPRRVDNSEVRLRRGRRAAGS